MSKWLLVLLLAGCAAQPREALPAKPPVIEVHADPNFLPFERLVIYSAVAELPGRFSLTFDKQGGNRIERLENDSLIATVLSAQYEGLLYGATYQGQPWRIYIIPDRIDSARFLKHVLEHELCHALGAQHNDNPTDLMYRISVPDRYDAINQPCK